MKNQIPFHSLTKQRTLTFKDFSGDVWEENKNLSMTRSMLYFYYFLQYHSRTVWKPSAMWCPASHQEQTHNDRRHNDWKKLFFKSTLGGCCTEIPQGERVDWALEQVSLENLLPISCRSPIAGNLSLASYLTTVVSVAIFCIFKEPSIGRATNIFWH